MHWIGKDIITYSHCSKSKLTTHLGLSGKLLKFIQCIMIFETRFLELNFRIIFQLFSELYYLQYVHIVLLCN